MPASMTMASRVVVAARASPSPAVATPLRRISNKASASSRRRSASASSSSSRLNGAAVANAAAKTLAVDKLRSDEDEEELGAFGTKNEGYFEKRRGQRMIEWRERAFFCFFDERRRRRS